MIVRQTPPSVVGGGVIRGADAHPVVVHHVRSSPVVCVVPVPERLVPTPSPRVIPVPAVFVAVPDSPPASITRAAPLVRARFVRRKQRAYRGIPEV